MRMAILGGRGPDHRVHSDAVARLRWWALVVSISLSTGTALAASPDVVISQVYGGGGNSGATYKNDFIELHNTAATPVTLAGWSVQYASATGTAWQVTTLSGTLQPGQFYLVQEAAGTGGTTSLPTPDATGTINLSGTAGKVALVTSTTALACGSSCATNAAVRDYVGFGTTANNFEGTGPAPAPSNTTADVRPGSACTDTDNNSTDFVTAAPAPRNSATALSTCSAPPVNGVCGTSNNLAFTAAPTTGLCSVGSASSVTGSGPWNWTCAGSNGGTTASCSATLSTGGPFTIFHMNDVHARVSSNSWIVSQHSPTQAGFQAVGGAAYLAGELETLVGANPAALVLDGGDLSEGNPLGDMNGISATGTITASTTTGIYGNQGLTNFYAILSNKLQAISGRGGRGIDAIVVGNHDVRDASYIANMQQMAVSTGIPVISANVRDVSTHQPHFPATTTLTVNGTKIGIIGYTTPSATVGPSLTGSLEVVQCGWNTTPAGAANAVNPCHIADYVNDLRNNQHCNVVILLTHDGHSDLVNPTAPVLADTVDAKVPEIAVTGHWHTYADTVWQPAALNYKTIFTESASFTKYIGELNVDAAGRYLSSTQHALINGNITPDADVQAYVANLETTYNTLNTATPVNSIVGYTASDLLLDDVMKWWSADEYPWNGNDTAGQWITDAMVWKCLQLFGACDLAIEAGGGVRSDIPAGPVSYRQIYETYPWADDTYYRVNMTGQDLINFLTTTNLDAGFSSQLDVTAFDGIITSVLLNGQPLNPTQTYTVAINNYMYVNPPSGYVWTDTAPLTSSVLVRDSLVQYMQQVHPTPAQAYQTGGSRYHLNGSYSGGYRAVVTMVNDQDSQLSYDDAFIRFISANPETLARLGGKQVPTSIVNADGSIVAGNRLAEQELYRSFLGFKTGALHPGDIIETWGKSSFYGGNPEFVDQEGVYGDGVEFKIVGHDPSLAKPVFQSSIGAFFNDNYKNHYVQFLARKSGTSTVADQYGQTIQIWDATAYTAKTLPGNVGDILLISGVPTMENYALRFRSDAVAVSTSTLPTPISLSSRVDPQLATASAAITLSATASAGGNAFTLTPVADAQVESATAYASTNFGTSNNLYVQSSSVSPYGNERAWLKFDLSGIPAGSTITNATLQMWNWTSAGAALAVEVDAVTDDTWTETGITWNTQPAFGAAIDTQTFAAATKNVWRNWNVTSFIQGQFAGDKIASLVVKPVTEGSTDATAPSYGFDSKEYGSNAPVLAVTTQSSGATVASVRFFYRYSADNATWGAWTQIGAAVTAAPYTMGFSFPSGFGYYEFYSIATDSTGNTEPVPAAAQTAVHYQAASGSTQHLTFPATGDIPVGSTVSVSASSDSGLPVTISSNTPGTCVVGTGTVSTIAVGTCTLTASQAGDSGYILPATAVQSLNVLALGQTISFAPLSDQALANGSVSVSASATSGLPIQFTSQTPASCSVSGATVTLVAVGVCTIAADQAGGGSYAAAPTVVRSFNVTGAAAVGGNDADVPVPPWALALLSLAMLAAFGRAMRRS